MTVTNGMYMIRNCNFLHPLAVSKDSNAAQIQPHEGPYEIKEKALWKITVIEDDELDLVSVYHQNSHLIASTDGTLKVNQRKKEELDKWKIRLLPSGYYTLEKPNPKEGNQRVVGVDSVGVTAKRLPKTASANDPIAPEEEWDIHYIKESYFAFRNRQFGSYLYAGKNSKDIASDTKDLFVRMAETGIPRKFIWEATLIGDSYTLRNLEANKVLEIPNGKESAVTCGNNSGKEWSRWSLNRGLNHTLFIINCARNAAIQQNAALEVTYPDKNHKEREIHPYTVSWSIRDPSTTPLPKHALWKLEPVAPNRSFVEPRVTSERRKGAIKNGLMVTIPVECTKETPFNSASVPNSGLYYSLEESVKHLQKQNESRQREIVALSGKLYELQSSLSDTIDNQITHLEQKTTSSLIELKTAMPELIVEEVAKRITLSITQQIKQDIEDTLAPIRNDLALLKAQIKKLEKK